MDERALLALHARLGPGQLERLAHFAANRGALLLEPSPGLGFTLAVTTALRCVQREGADPEPGTANELT